MVVFAGFFLDEQSNHHVFSRSLPYALSTITFESCELAITSSNVVCWAFMSSHLVFLAGLSRRCYISNERTTLPIDIATSYQEDSEEILDGLIILLL